MQADNDRLLELAERVEALPRSVRIDEFRSAFVLPNSLKDEIVAALRALAQDPANEG